MVVCRLASGCTDMDSNANMVHFGFSWSDRGDHSGVGYFAPMRDSCFCYKEDGVGASFHAGTDALA